MEKSLIKKIFKAFLAVSGLAFAALCLFFYQVICSLDLEKITSSSPPKAQQSEVQDHVEQGGLVRKDDFKLFWIWNNYDLSFEEFEAENSDTWDAINKNSELYFKEDLLLSALKGNDCDLTYCLQSRLRFPEIPSLLWRGLIGIEDYRFLDHKGVDPRSLLRALWHDLMVLRLEQGGSTLTQQLAKNLFYTNEKKFSRKIKEMIASTYIEYKLEKEQILQAYFNEVMWGSLQGIKIKGIAAASLFYFLKKPQKLEPFEVSILISLLKGPYYYSPVNHPDRLKGRAHLVFKKLKELMLFPANSTAWSDEQWSRWQKRITERSQGVALRALYKLLSYPEKSYRYENFVLLREVEALNQELKQKYKKSDFAIKLKKFSVKTDDSFEAYSKFERSLEKAIKEERHQVGSTLKPIIFGLLEENDFSLNQEVSTLPLTLNLKSGAWSPRESHDSLTEKVTYEEALIESLNRPVVRAVQEYGFDKFEEILKIKIPHLKTPLSEYPAQLLGAVELSLAELAAIYGDFLNKACLRFGGSRVIKALSDPKKTTIRFRVGEKLGQMRFFGKTGTSNNGFDSWFVGFDGREVLATWVGLEGPRDKEKEFKLYGSNSAFVIYRNFYRYRGKLFNEMPCQ